MQHTLTLTIHFDDAHTTLVVSKCQQLQEFLQLSGVEISASADHQTLTAINQHFKSSALTIEPSQDLTLTTAQTATSPSTQAQPSTTNSSGAHTSEHE